MPSKSKRKGNTYERELVERLRGEGFDAERAWGSNGAALGEHEEVDLRFESGDGRRWKVQAKRRAKLPAYLKPSEHVDMVIAREDRGEDLVVVPLYLFLELVRES